MHTPKDSMCAVSNPHLSSAAGFGTLPDRSLQVAGFHRAVPSTALDKACMQFVYILLEFSHLSTLFSDKIHNSFMDISPKK